MKLLPQSGMPHATPYIFDDTLKDQCNPDVFSPKKHYYGISELAQDAGQRRRPL